MNLKKILWYILTILLLSFLFYYIITSIIYLSNYAFEDTTLWKKIFSLVSNFLILVIELFSAFYSVFIYYYIGSSTGYRLIKDEKNKFLSRTPLHKVVITIPLYKEPLAVVSKTIQGALSIDYPKDRLEIVVCDDSPPGFSEDIEQFCVENKVTFIHRKTRKGFKAGALNNVLDKVECDFFGILDSDHIPTPNFVKTCLSGFVDEDIIFVQGKPMFVNQDDYLMRSSAYIHTQFFHIYQKSRGTRDGVIFAGTTGIFRADLLKENGGFLEDTLAEDTDTSFVLMSKGYKTRYLHEICSKGLVPWNPISMINQVWRWTNGITSIFRKRLWVIITGKNSVINKIDILSTVSTPIIGVTMWFVYLLLYVMYLIPVAPILISLASIIMAIVAWTREEKEDRMIKLRGFWGMVWTIGAFYLLMLTAQSFLVWAVVSALLGIRKDFDRTIKERTKSMGKVSKKVKYTLWSLALFALSIFYYKAAVETFLAGSTLSGWFLMGAVSITIPIIIVITNFRKLELMRVFAATKTADDVEKEYAGMKKNGNG